MTIKTLATIALAGGLAISLSACGSSTAGSNSANGVTQNQNGNGQGVGGGNGFAGRIPGANGLVAAVSGSTAQVQSSSAQTAVTWNSSTTFTDEVKVAKSAVKVGECVQASRALSSSSSSSSSSTLTAGIVRIVSTSGGCPTATAGFGGGSRPSGAPTAFPGGQGANRPRAAGGFGTLGVVTAVSSSGFVVKPTRFGGTSSTSPVTVTTTASTTYTQTEKASASAVRVGVCMSANGTTSDTGAVTARRITLSQPTDGACTQARFGGGFPGGGRPGGQGAPQNG